MSSEPAPFSFPLRLAPINVPMKRRIQTFAVLMWALIIPCSLIATVLMFLCPPLWPFLIVYATYIYWDRESSRTGKKRSAWFRSLTWWKHYRDYFPIRLVKSVNLDPRKNYVFGYHPHGIISVGCFTNFTTEANRFSKLFPGIKLHPLTLVFNMRVPFLREVLLRLGVCDVSKDTCNFLLQQGPGSSIMIVIGGALEALNAHPGCNDLILNRRKGFVRVALRNNAELVPVFSFGENDVFDQLSNPPGSRLRNLQEGFCRMVGISLPIFHGRGVFNYNFGLLPHRRPITTVVGAPVPLPKLTTPGHPTLKEVEDYHLQYLSCLKALYDKHKDVLAPHRQQSLRVIQ